VANERLNQAGGVATDATRHVEELPDRDLPAVRNPANVAAHGVAQTELPALHQLQDERRGNRLGDAPDRESVMKPEPAAASAIRGANRGLEAADLRLPEAGREPGVMHVPLPTLHRLLHPSALIGRKRGGGPGSRCHDSQQKNQGDRGGSSARHLGMRVKPGLKRMRCPPGHAVQRQWPPLRSGESRIWSDRRGRSPDHHARGTTTDRFRLRDGNDGPLNNPLARSRSGRAAVAVKENGVTLSRLCSSL
jgi:hypothetical protein